MNVQRRRNIDLRSRMISVRLEPFDWSVCLRLAKSGQGERVNDLVNRVAQLGERVARVRKILSGGPMPAEDVACYVAERDLSEAEALLLLLEEMRDGLGREVPS